MIYKTTLFLFVLLCAASASAAFAQEHRFQHVYKESIYEPVPPEYHKLTGRLKHWNTIAEAELNKLASSTHPKVKAWRNKIKAMGSKDGLELLNNINSITNNAVKYVDDYYHYHQKDFWAPPYETLIEGGDCEDIALLKAVALHMHGWDMTERGHVLIGMIDFHGKQTAHAVLEVNRGDGTYHIMRSINDDVPTFDEMDKIMKPIYMISSKNLVVFKDNGTHLAYNVADEKVDFNFSSAAGEERSPYND